MINIEWLHNTCITEYHTVNEPITFPCRADALHITPRTRVNRNVKYELRKSGFLQNFSNKDGHLKLQNGFTTTKKRETFYVCDLSAPLYEYKIATRTLI